MFAWYRDSAKCYVYLNDVTIESYTQDDLPWLFGETDYHPANLLGSDETPTHKSRDSVRPLSMPHERDRPSTLEIYSDLAKSRWFTRGWTLQELLAPKQLEFYSKSWVYLGSLDDLVEPVSEIAKIQESVLRKQDRIESFSIACRMSWASRRKTTRIEDEAYCLLGLFEINMPLLYGEGAKAFIRLQKEIIQVSSDQSILVWQRSDAVSPFDSLFSFPALAWFVARFSNCQWISTSGSLLHNGRATFEVTHRGFEMHGRVLNASDRPGCEYIILDCVDVRHRERALALEARHFGGDWYELTGEVIQLPVHQVRETSRAPPRLFRFNKTRSKECFKRIILKDTLALGQQQSRGNVFRVRSVSNNPRVDDVRLVHTYPKMTLPCRDLIRVGRDSPCAFRIQINELLKNGERVSRTMVVGIDLWGHTFFVGEETEDTSWDLRDLFAQLESGTIEMKHVVRGTKLQYNRWWTEMHISRTAHYNICVRADYGPSHDAYPQMVFYIDRRFGVLNTLALAPRVLLGSKAPTERSSDEYCFEDSDTWQHLEAENILSDQLSLYSSRWERYRMLLGDAWQESSAGKFLQKSQEWLSGKVPTSRRR